MNSLNLPNPKMMDVAVPANMRVGLVQDEIARRGWAVTARAAMEFVGQPEVALIDLRERSEREKHGVIPGSLHAPYPELAANIRAGGMLHALASAPDKRVVFYCAFGERSAMAVQAAHDAGIRSACHIQGGLDAWKKAGGPLARVGVPGRAGTRSSHHYDVAPADRSATWPVPGSCTCCGDLLAGGLDRRTLRAAGGLGLFAGLRRSRRSPPPDTMRRWCSAASTRACRSR